MSGAGGEKEGPTVSRHFYLICLFAVVTVFCVSRFQQSRSDELNENRFNDLKRRLRDSNRRLEQTCQHLKAADRENAELNEVGFSFCCESYCR